MRRPTLPAVLALSLLATAAPAQDESAGAHARLTAAKAQSAAAAGRAARLERAAARQADAVRRARIAEAALNARIQATQADIVAARARVALVERLVVAQRARLAADQAPVARLMAALQSLAARPTLAAVVQPGSIDDLVHVRAILGATLPTVRARTAEVRAELDRTRALQASAALAATALADGRRRLEAQRLAFVRLEAERRLRARTPGGDALFESDRALALGEQARDLIGALALAQDAAAVEARLVTLGGPLPRPDEDGIPVPAVPAYRLPVAGRIVQGLGELSDTGVRARGLAIAAAPGTRVVAPAAGRVRYAGRFRDYGRVVVIDHGGGWTSALIGLDGATAAVGTRVRAGDPVGRAPATGRNGDGPRITVELRRRDRPVDLAALIG